MTANLKYFALVALTALVAVFGRPSQTNAQVLLRKEQQDPALKLDYRNVFDPD